MCILGLDMDNESANGQSTSHLTEADALMAALSLNGHSRQSWLDSHLKRPYNAYGDYFGSVFRGATRNLVSFGARFLLVG